MALTFSFKSRLLALLLAHALAAASVGLAQDAAQTRPRRVWPSSSPDEEVAPPPSATPPLTRLAAEPVVRVGLTTGARSVSVSTAGQPLLVRQETGGADAPTQLTAARVRIEPRVFSPLPPTPGPEELFRVEIAAPGTRAEAEGLARQAREITNEGTEVTSAGAGGTWAVRVGEPVPQAAAEELRARLEEAGVASVSLTSTRPTEDTKTRTVRGPSAARSDARPTPQQPAAAGPNQTGRSPAGVNTRAPRAASGGVRLTSAAGPPSRGLAVYAGDAAKLLDARAPLTFSSADEQNAPLRFNERQYRGRIEVFANARGALTVVNVVGLEDYVRGVVPNELSPGGYPALEALKAQAVAARTYALKHRGQFEAAGFDLLPTIRSQVYGGKSTEHPLATRAVEETRGVVATYQGQPIDALYTSTCGGRTEDAAQIFGGQALPYLRVRECALDAHAAQGPNSTIESSREPPSLREAVHVAGARAAVLLAVHGLRLPPRVTDDWLGDDVEADEVRPLLDLAARLARRPPPAAQHDDVTRPPAFASALLSALDGESRADVLLGAADVNYLLAFRDAQDVPARNRADVAWLLREGHLSLFPDATLRPRQQLSRARALHAAARLLEARGLFNLQKATARSSAANALNVRAGKGPERRLQVAASAYLFRAFGEQLFQVRAINIVGGEPLVYHTDARGEIDYLEVRPAPDGAAAERFSPFTNWTTRLSAAEVARRLARHAARIGSVTDIRVAARGASRRLLDLEVVGAQGTAHVRGGRIRSALGLREQLFTIERRTDEAGRPTEFVFHGRGYGHGVGMCQTGAYGLARAGRSYGKILQAYYTDVRITKLY